MQQLCKSCRTCFKFYCTFYFTCDRCFSTSNGTGWVRKPVEAQWRVIRVVRGTWDRIDSTKSSLSRRWRTPSATRSRRGSPARARPRPWRWVTDPPASNTDRVTRLRTHRIQSALIRRQDSPLKQQPSVCLSASIFVCKASTCSPATSAPVWRNVYTE